MKRILVVFGTRPEAIKMCPLVNELKSRTDKFKTIVCVTGQHKEMLDQVLEAFDVKPDYNLAVMKRNQTLFDITSEVLLGMDEVLTKAFPDCVLVHGDTTTSFVTGLAAFYRQIPVGHVEAGLRTWNLGSPFPEEFNRQAVDVIAKYHFAPTETSKNNLIAEGKDPDWIFVTGNTGIDALRTTIESAHESELISWADGSRLILVTAHRRENLGAPMRSMFRAIRRVLEEFEDVRAVYPIHMNPLIREIADNEFSGNDHIRITSPLDVLEFHNILQHSYLVLTDSGGIQEEAPSLGKPVLVMRDTTERPEGVAAGTLKLVGVQEEDIYGACKTLLESEDEYQKMSKASNPYGDGTAAKQIVDILAKKL